MSNKTVLLATALTSATTSATPSNLGSTLQANPSFMKNPSAIIISTFTSLAYNLIMSLPFLFIGFPLGNYLGYRLGKHSKPNTLKKMYSPTGYSFFATFIVTLSYVALSWITNNIFKPIGEIIVNRMGRGGKIALGLGLIALSTFIGKKVYKTVIESGKKQGIKEAKDKAREAEEAEEAKLKKQDSEDATVDPSASTGEKEDVRDKAGASAGAGASASASAEDPEPTVTAVPVTEPAAASTATTIKPPKAAGTTVLPKSEYKGKRKSRRRKVHGDGNMSLNSSAWSVMTDETDNELNTSTCSVGSRATNRTLTFSEAGSDGGIRKRKSVRRIIAKKSKP